jgi:hypothetical protein
MRTVQALAARASKDVAVGLARTFSAMPAEKQTWSPLDEGRTALDQVAECAVINSWCAIVIRDHVVPAFEGETYKQECAKLDTPDKALAALTSSTDQLVAAIENLQDEHLESTVQFPWDSEPSTLGYATLVPYWNMTYHIGQINYIQTLYGDKQDH